MSRLVKFVTILSRYGVLKCANSSHWDSGKTPRGDVSISGIISLVMVGIWVGPPGVPGAISLSFAP